MTEFYIIIDAPFASFRKREIQRVACYPVMPVSAATGFVLNLAGYDGLAAAGDDALDLELITGLVRKPVVNATYQQLHIVPSDSKCPASERYSNGRKRVIRPVAREILVNGVYIIGVRCRDSLYQRVVNGLAGELNHLRTGLPFAGENDCVPSRIEIVSEPPAAEWFDACTDLGRLATSMTSSSGPSGLVTLPVRVDFESNTSQYGVFIPTSRDAGVAIHNGSWCMIPSE